MYKKLVQGRIGIVVSGYSYVLPNGRSNAGQSGIYADDLVPAWKQVTKVFKDSAAQKGYFLDHAAASTSKK